MTLTIELPEDLAARLASMPESERPRFAIAAMRKDLPSSDELEVLEGEELDELVTIVNAGIEALESGEKGYTPEEQDSLLHATFPWLKSQPQTAA